VWWKKHEVFCPILAGLAKFYLSVQATSAPSERVFSAANTVIGVGRTSLHTAMAGRLLFVSRNWEWFLNEVNLEDAIRSIMPEE